MGPLAGIKIIEIAGLGAAPYGCMMLADLGAEVVRIERPGGNADTPAGSPLLRNRRTMEVDLKCPEGAETVLALVEKADVLIEAFRPGVAERLGIGPEECLARNPALVYGRMTGWGQSGPLSQSAGHDLNYIGLTGLLHQIGPTGGKPVVPLNVIGDFGGGGLLLAFGVVSALLHARQTGQGQVVDAAMLDGAISFMSMFFGYREEGLFLDGPGRNFLGGGAHYYDVYQTADGKFLSVAPIEPQFYRRFISLLGVEPERFLPAGYPSHSEDNITRDWPELKKELEKIFLTRTRDQWCNFFNGEDVCVSPVLDLDEALAHPHNQSREAFVEVGGVQQNAPAPRFSKTPAPIPQPPADSAVDTMAVLADWQVSDELVKRAQNAGALGASLK